MRPYTRKITLVASLVTVPIVVFTVTLCWLVFANLVNETSCPLPKLCPKHDILQSTGGYYYVDYPAARLVFIASWSSTISFSLISMLMTIFGYLMARRLLLHSETQGVETALPTPYQTSLLIRILSADALSLWDIGFDQVRAIFWLREQSTDSKQSGPSITILRRCLSFFIVCIFMSFLIQAADTYLHMVTEAVDMTQIKEVDVTEIQYSQGLAPWCLDRVGVGSLNNKNFWGCAISYSEPDGMEVYTMTNLSLWNDFDVGSASNYALNFTDEEGLQFAIIGPTLADPQIDWTATTIGVSTECAAVPRHACNLTDTDGGAWKSGYINAFDCGQGPGGVNMSGNMSTTMFAMHFYDFHKYLSEPPPFNQSGFLGEDTIYAKAANVTDDEEVFQNPWTHLSIVDIEEDTYRLPGSFSSDEGVWLFSGDVYYWMILVFWDITYTAIGGKIASMSRQKSNGSVAGMASMASSSAMGISSDILDRALARASSSAESPQQFIDRLAYGISQSFIVPIATQLSPRPALLAQRRISKVMTKIPTVAICLLVLANGLYALLGMGLAVLALIRTSPAVHQVQTRLSVTGLVAQLFEPERSRCAVGSESDLFSGSSGAGIAAVKRVGVKRTDTDGSVFVVNDSKEC
ncbi:hypothetical protein EJ04DRAFT_571109 [Polyplosphaeria fusca]|uniref:Uncharacterized protein n=1 Tax=Polyplosphaeria fusca TaxID=682080 RepID=A0A9P4QG22_9PLEO|nr:hypothetical protein EJ04DRAFT_571109 [Polyplosphaeria fusca]